MNEEKKIDNSEQTADGRSKYAIAGASAFIFNGEGKLLLTRSVKWDNLWVPPGGKVEFGENIKQTLKREMKEELNLDIGTIKYLTTIELNRPKERPNLHLIVNEFVAEAVNDGVKLNDEHSEFDWRTPEEWLKDKDLYPNVREVIEYYLKEYLPKQDCENLYKRALADYQNLLKQTAKEKMEFAVFANEQMLKEILPVYDHLKLALEHHNGESTDDWLKGVEHVVKQFKDALNKIGVEEILVPTEASGNVKDGEFDHNTMDAVGSEETEDESLDGLVARQVKAGYKLNGKVIEPAKVVVYKMTNDK